MLSVRTLAFSAPSTRHPIWRQCVHKHARPLLCSSRARTSMGSISTPQISKSEASTGTYEEMVDVHSWLRERVCAALGESFGPEFADVDPLVTPATKLEFGDYQCNAALSLAKQLKSKPRDVAQTLKDALQIAECCEPPDIAGPGFLNFKLKGSFIAAQLRVMLADSARCGVPLAQPAQRVVVDYSSPNIAKEMHVGHLRSTIIGDTLATLLEFRGHNVLRLNHVGDWGTQFGMLITHMREVVPDALSPDSSASSAVQLEDLVAFYKQAKARFDAEPEFQEASRAEVVRLQAGDQESREMWKMLCDQSEVAFKQVYTALRVDAGLITRGESFYNDRLEGVISSLRKAELLQESDGAQCVFLQGYTNRDGEPLPMIVQKRDGGYMYSTTDLAAVQQRVTDEKADRVLYVTDAGQATHFEQVFQICRRAELVSSSVSLQHVPFGLVLGEDGKKFKTRSGETVKLMVLLDEARSRARADIEARLQAEGRDEGDDFVANVADAVGIGAVKYADLAMNRNSNYRFSFDKMLSLTGNTAPYMMYAFARIRGIQRRAGEATTNASPDNLVLDHISELNLARALLRLPQVIMDVERELLPSKLAEYIFDLAGKFNQFYESCPVLAAPTEEIKCSRLALCSLTATVLGLNLRLLGIRTLERL
eukprot:CAMPEP_0119302804 /NCGR_PEP_ID=MMETSP1333-20130426/4348_1 /TAXON_ID=418940 /ORGANISM="Scyphosphaera apsteinii, Strain RCC1455" /LENGTH=652 /DNA_ID=CAMNT_0007305277 /DNA_START=103 /DNA_END=2061 /DNA_ORIENTATION=-